MNKYISNILAGSMAVMSLAACSSDFLETAPTSSIATTTVFSTTENIKMAINGIASQMYTQYSAWSQGYCGENRIKSIYNEYPSQEFRYNVFAPGWDVIYNGEYYTQKSKTYCNYPWAYYYGLISSANSIIANVDGATGLDTDKLFYKAQALTFRAYAYEKLLELYTPRWQDTNNGQVNGVVLRLDESTGGIPLSTVKECYDQIYKDLDDAISYFKQSGQDRASGEVWLTNINTAYAVYARAALNRQDYSTALANAKLAENGYPLMSNADYASGFCKPTSEWIFGSYDDSTENKWYWTFGTQFACNGYYANNTYYGAGDIEKELTDRMPTNDARMACFLTADKFEGIDVFNGVGTAVQQDGSVAKVYHMNHTYGWMDSDEAWAIAKAYVNSRTPSGLSNAYQAGYYYLNGQLKFWVFGTPGVSYNCHIRSSEMVLIEAEANYFLGNESAAIEALVRLNKTSGRNPEYSCSKSGEDLFQEIVDYRELELWGEGFNWYDVKRWNRDIVRKSFAEGGNCHTATAVTVAADKNDWTWAIPETESDYNKNLYDKE
jgi:hypothetical protein